MFIMIDGIDGSGKSTAVQAWKDYLVAQGKTIFDLKSYWQTNGKHPELEEVKSYDFIFSCEPTYTGVGKVIREEFIKNGANYPAQAIAEAYSLDRLVLYKKIILPFLEMGKTVIQDRGVSTTLCYQSIQTDFTFEKIGQFVGNQLALENRPDHLIIAKIDPQIAATRIGSRFDKTDDAIFEKIDFLKKAADVFYSDAYQNIFKEKGSAVTYLNTEVEIDIMKQEAVSLLKKLISA